LHQTFVVNGRLEGSRPMASHIENAISQPMNYAPADLNPQKDLPNGFFDFLLPLHKQFTPRQQKLVAKRAEVLRASHRGQPPNYLPASEASSADWRIEAFAPEDFATVAEVEVDELQSSLSKQGAVL